MTRDEDTLLETLTTRVRLASLTQLRALAARPHTVNRLLRRGIIDKAELAVFVPVLDRPLWSWRPGRREPDYQALAWLLEKRRQGAVPAPATICWASSHAVRLVGGHGGRIRQPMQVEHDLGTTAILVRRQVLDPRTRAGWLGEDVFRQMFGGKGKVPDAVLLSPAGRVATAIEYGGVYSAEHLRRFHRACAKEQLPYELW